VVRCGAHRPMEHIQSFTRSQWMPPSGECLRRIVPAAAKVIEFEFNTQNTNKTQLLASNYVTFRALVVCKNFNPKTDPLNSSSVRQASCKYETSRLELKNSRIFLAIKVVRCQKLEKLFSNHEARFICGAYMRH
jgi:hypothetical protein